MLLVPSLLLVVAFWITTQSNSGQSEWFMLVTVYLLIMAMWTCRQLPSSLEEFVFYRFKPLSFFKERP